MKNLKDKKKINTFIKNINGLTTETEYESNKQNCKNIINRFILDTKNLKQNITLDNLLEFYFSCNAIGLSVYPNKKDLIKWIETGIKGI